MSTLLVKKNHLKNVTQCACARTRTRTHTHTHTHGTEIPIYAHTSSLIHALCRHSFSHMQPPKAHTYLTITHPKTHKQALTLSSISNFPHDRTMLSNPSILKSSKRKGWLQTCNVLECNVCLYKLSLAVFVHAFKCAKVSNT